MIDYYVTVEFDFFSKERVQIVNNIASDLHHIYKEQVSDFEYIYYFKDESTAEQFQFRLSVDSRFKSKTTIGMY